MIMKEDIKKWFIEYWKMSEEVAEKNAELFVSAAREYLRELAWKLD